MDSTHLPENMDFEEQSEQRTVKKKKDKGKKPAKAKKSQEQLVKKEETESVSVDPETTAFPPTFSVSEIKNKQRRHVMFMKLKQEKRKVL